MTNQNRGHRGVDPQPNHGNDDKGHQEGKGNGVIIKPGVSHALKLSNG